MTTIRDYQAECRDAVLAAWGEKPWHTEGEMFRSVLVNLSTSAGKTVIAGDIIQTVKERGKCLFIADTDELCEQPRDKFKRLFDMPAAVEKASREASLQSDVVIGSAQTLQRQERLERFPRDHFGYIFVDEAHRGSDRNKVITDYFPWARVMGMTATAFRAKKADKSGLADLSDYYDTVAYEMGMFDLIDEGYLVPLKVLALPVIVDISEIRQTMTTEGMEYDRRELDTTITPYFEEICAMIKEHAPNRQIIAYLPLIKTSMAFVGACSKAKIEAHHVDGKSPDRDRLIEEFAAGEFQLLANSALLTTGWDCPLVDCLLNLAPTRSVGLFRQKVGRIGRVLPGTIDGIEDKDQRKAAIAQSAKPDSLILDLLWQVERFGVSGPSDLIAANVDEKAALEAKLKKTTGARDLQEVSREVQEEREKALKEALEEAAKRKARLEQMAGDSIELVAAILHSKKLADYEPTMRWHRLPVTEPQKAWLAKNGINPATARDRGHASEVMNLIFARKNAGRAPYRAVAALEKASIGEAVKMSASQAFEILGGNYPMGFGKHAAGGRTLRQVPNSYWEWCLEQDWFARVFPIEYRWAKSLFPELDFGPEQSSSDPADYFDCVEPENRS